MLSAEHYWDTRLDPGALALVDAQMTWGQAEADILARYPSHTGIPVHVTGNARGDLMRPEFHGFFDREVASIRERFGRPILVNTNFSIVNPYFSSLSKYSAATLAEKKSDAHFANVEFREFRADMFARMRALVPELAAAFPDTQIVVRPHPGENAAAWREAAAASSNAHVVFEGAVVPWLLASTALVHNGCTTAVEAGVLGVPAIAYEPVRSELYAEDIANGLSRSVSSPSELFDVVRSAAAGDSDADGAVARNEPGARARLVHHLASLDGALASERILDVVDALDPGDTPPRGERVAARLHAEARALTKRVNALVPGHKNNATYTRHRFPGLTEYQVRERIGRLAAASGRFSDVEVYPLGKNIFEIR